MELEDFEAFTEAEFSATAFAASLLSATNVLDDTELDLATPTKKLQFDANECERRMDKLAATHYELLINNFGNIDATRALMEQSINPLAQRMRKAYERIHNDIVGPYDDAVRLNGALRKVHATASLLRGAGFFLLFVQQLQDCERAMELGEDNRDVVRLARLHRQLAGFFAKQDGVDLLSLRLVRDYHPLFQVKNAELVADLSAKISNDLGHHSLFMPDNAELQHNMVALHVLDDAEFLAVVDKMAMAKLIQIAVTLATRALQSPRNLSAVLAEIKQTALVFCSTLALLLANCATDLGTLLEVFEASLKDEPTPSVEAVYWARLAYRFKKNIAATMARGGPIARNLRSLYASIVEAADSVLEDPAATHIKEALSIIDTHN